MQHRRHETTEDAGLGNGHLLSEMQPNECWTPTRSTVSLVLLHAHAGLLLLPKLFRYSSGCVCRPRRGERQRSELCANELSSSRCRRPWFSMCQADTARLLFSTPQTALTSFPLRGNKNPIVCCPSYGVCILGTVLSIHSV